jgi:hypothetical protein
VYSSNYDFTVHNDPSATKLFKLHGTIGKDISDGHVYRLIISESDYDYTGDYRAALYDRLRGDMAGGHLVVIGHSLKDAHVRSIVNRAIELASQAPGAWRISLLLFEGDQNRALLFERRGLTVCFGGIDDLFARLSKVQPDEVFGGESDDLLGEVPALRPVTVDVAHRLTLAPNFGSMFNGWPASHADIRAGFTFPRLLAEEVSDWLRSDDALCAIVLGASGVGKTTAARQALQSLKDIGYQCWEHDVDHALNEKSWMAVAKKLQEKRIVAVLLIDEAHSQLQGINELVDRIATENLTSLKLICVSTRNHWGPRIKTPNLFRIGKEFKLGRLARREIDSLLGLVDSNEQVRALVERTFSGFSRHERRRRLVNRCGSEMFVCLKNIFASEKFDDIILREYASLDSNHQGIYKVVAALESAGVKVHRQLIIRLLGIPAESIRAALVHLADIISEYTIDKKEGLFGWRCRHYVIASIIAKYKFPEAEDVTRLFSDVIDNISPTYDIELLSMRELCNVESGIPSIPDKAVQNTLLRKMMSIAPGERVPRHRLIRNLIRMGEFEKAETEIRIFENDFGADGPVARYKVDLLTARAKNAPGIMEEDRVAILRQAGALAGNSTKRFPYNKSLLASYCEVGIELCRRAADCSIYDDAMQELRQAEDRLGDPDIPKWIARYESRIRGFPVISDDELDEQTE